MASGKNCYHPHLFRVHRAGFKDFIASQLGLRPFECDHCEARIYKRQAKPTWLLWTVMSALLALVLLLIMKWLSLDAP